MKARLVRALLRVFAALPFRAAQGAGAVLGWLHWLLPNRLRRISRANIAQCYPDQPARWRRRLLRESLVETGKSFGESAWFWGRGAAAALPLVREVTGREHLDRALAAGTGVLFATPHMGAWELAAAYGAREMPLTVLFRPPKVEALAGVLAEGRAALGMRPVPTDAGGVRAMHRALARGEGVGMLPDQQPRDGHGVVAPFFGQPALTMTLLPRLARKSEAAVLVALMERLPRGRGFRLRFWPADAAIRSADPVTAATAVNGDIERCIAVAPAQYTWSYKRFRQRGRPRGAASLSAATPADTRAGSRRDAS